MLMNALIFLIGLAGAALIAAGTWLIFQPAGYIAGGVLLLAWSFMAARAAAISELKRSKKGDN